jgi:hypothetical protein
MCQVVFTQNTQSNSLCPRPACNPVHITFPTLCSDFVGTGPGECHPFTCSPILLIQVNDAQEDVAKGDSKDGEECAASSTAGACAVNASKAAEGSLLYRLNQSFCTGLSSCCLMWYRRLPVEDA